MRPERSIISGGQSWPMPLIHKRNQLLVIGDRSTTEHWLIDDRNAASLTRPAVRVPACSLRARVRLAEGTRTPASPYRANQPALPLLRCRRPLRSAALAGLRDAA